jgi:hypothetical protein
MADQKRTPKQKSKLVYRGKPLRRENQAQVAKAADFTPEQIEKLKADFIDALNAFANRRR